MQEAYFEALKSNKNGGKLVFWKINPQNKYQFDIGLVKKCLEEYLLGESYSQRYVKCYYQVPDNICGINTYDFLILHMYEKNKQMLKCLHNLLDHKKLMLLRLKFMEEQKYIHINLSLNYEETVKKASIACNQKRNML